MLCEYLIATFMPKQTKLLCKEFYSINKMPDFYLFL